MRVGSAVGAILVAGAGAIIAARSRQAGSGPSTDSRTALITYLQEHLTGSEVAIQVVERLRRTAHAPSDARLFAFLFNEFEAERRVVHALLVHLGSSAQSAKRLVGHVAGSLVKFTAGGTHGDLSLFRTLEALAIGVQGKRCLWRALERVESCPPLSAGRTLADLEAAALRQWDAIEERRQALVASTFATPRP